MFNGRRQPSCDGTSRMTRECQVRICERLGVKFPGPTRHGGRATIGGAPGNIGSPDASVRDYGYAADLDYRVTADTTLGFALGGGGTDWSVANALGTGRSDVFQGGLYGSTRWERLSLRTAAGRGHPLRRVPGATALPSGLQRGCARWFALCADVQRAELCDDAQRARGLVRQARLGCRRLCRDGVRARRLGA